MNFIGDNLRKIRNLYEVKQEDIALFLGISTRQYRKLENDDVPVKDKYLIQLAQYYDISVDKILYFENSHFILSDSHIDLPQNAPADCKQAREFYERVIRTKDKIIQSQQQFIDFLKTEIQKEKSGN